MSFIVFPAINENVSWEIARIVIPAIVSIAAIFIAASISRHGERTKRRDEMIQANFINYINCLNSFLSEVLIVGNDMVDCKKFFYLLINSKEDYNQIIKLPLKKAVSEIRQNNETLKTLKIEHMNQANYNLYLKLYTKASDTMLLADIGKKYGRDLVSHVMVITEELFEKHNNFMGSYSLMFSGDAPDKVSIYSLIQFIEQYNKEIGQEFFSFQEKSGKWLKKQKKLAKKRRKDRNL